MSEIEHGAGHGAGHGGEAAEEEHIHMPGPSAWPFTLAVSLTVAMAGLMTWERLSLAVTGIIFLIGAAGMVTSIIRWSIQVSEA